MKGGATRGGLPKPGPQDRARLVTANSATSALGMKASRSSSALSTDLRLSRLKRASSDEALAKPGLGSASVGSRLRKTVTSEAISELTGTRPRSLTGGPTSKKSGIPSPKEMAPSITRERVSLRDQLRTGAPKKIIPSSSTLTALPKHPRASSAQKPKLDGEAGDKALLDCQVKELLAEAKAKDFEINKLRSELQRCRGRAAPEGGSPDGLEQASRPLEMLREENGRFQQELVTLQAENQALKEKLLAVGHSPMSSSSSPSPAHPSLNGVLPGTSNPTSAINGDGPLKISTDSSSDSTKSSLSPDSSEFEKIPSRSASVSSGAGVGTAGQGERVLSVEYLTEQIRKMEERHHSMAEELQATLQELADQQQVMQELTAENERLAEQKGLLQTSLQQQRERVEALAQKNQVLLARLESKEVESHTSRVAELEQRYAKLVESSRFEREKLVDIQQELSGSLRALEKEHQETQGQVRSLKDERGLLQSQLEKEREVSREVSRALEEQRASTEALRAENGRLRAQVEMEKQKALELKAIQSGSDTTELQGLLKAAHADKKRLELSCGELRQELAEATAKTEHVQGLLNKAETECQLLQERCVQSEGGRGGSEQSLAERLQERETQVKELKDTIFELEDQVEQHKAVRLHSNQTILDLENQVKKLDEQKFELEKQTKALRKQIKDETEEWRRFQADLQTAVVVANNIKVEAQQELRTLRRRLAEQQKLSAKLAEELELLQGSRSSTGSS
ncbi:hypothetical protein GJAV_G00129100 [Gymnothorax javanicus]|nr:hypothetical protein GJAV_G00129100 [Gymnothorax javanicus]